MGQTGWRLPDELLKRVRVHCAQTGERQNEFVRQALEDALTPRRTSAKKVEIALEARTAMAAHREGKPLAADTAPPLGKGFVPPRPKAK